MTHIQLQKREVTDRAFDVPDDAANFIDIAPGCFTYGTDEGPTSGILIGSERVMLIDAQPTQALTRDLIRRVRQVTDKPIAYVALTSCQSERVRNAYLIKGAQLIASTETRDLIQESTERRLDPNATYLPVPTITFRGAFTVNLGDFEAQIFQPGRGATRGDTVIWIRDHKLLFTGALVEAKCTPDLRYGYATEWPSTLEALMSLEAEKLVPGHGEALLHTCACQDAIFETRCFIEALYETVRDTPGSVEDFKEIFRCVEGALGLQYGQWARFDELMPYNVARACEEAAGVLTPHPWSPGREQALRRQLGLNS